MTKFKRPTSSNYKGLPILVAVMTSAFPSTCHAFPVGTYDYDGAKRQIVIETKKDMARADLILQCLDTDKILKVVPVSDRRSAFRFIVDKNGQPRLYKRSDLVTDSLSTDSKRLLVIWLIGNATGQQSDHIDEMCEKLQPVGESLGYKRLLIIALTQHSSEQNSHGIKIFRDINLIPTQSPQNLID